MRLKTSVTPVLLGFACLAAASTAGAATLVDAKVPFSFTVRDQTLPAGQYRVEQDDLDPSILVIHGERGIHANVVAPSVPATGRDPAGDDVALVFTRGEHGYRLTDVWAHRDDGREILQR